MSRILVRSGTPALAERLTTVLSRSRTAVEVATAPPPPPGAPDPYTLDPTALWHQDPAGPPAVVVLDAAVAGEAASLALAAALGARCPAVSVVLVSPVGPELALPALRAGATDLLHPEAGAEEVLRVLERAVELADVRRAQQAGPPSAESAAAASGRVISVVSPKGGVGKTTVATNLAVGLANAAPQATVLVDLDLQFGDVASGLDLDPEYYLPSAVRGPAASDTMVLKTFLTLHETGLYVLCAPELPADADGITAEDVARLLRMLATEFRYVVVDTAPGLSDHTLAAMDETTDLVLLTSMDVPGLRGLRKELDTLRELSMLQRRTHVVVNFADPGSGLSPADVEATIGVPVDLSLPRSKAAPASVNLGVPLLQSGVRDPMTKQLRALVGRITGGPPAAKPAPRARKVRSKPAPAPRRAASGWYRRPKAA